MLYLFLEHINKDERKKKRVASSSGYSTGSSNLKDGILYVGMSNLKSATLIRK